MSSKPIPATSPLPAPSQLLHRAIYLALPLAILTAYALWAFLPSRTMLPGIGDDPPFNAWHFLYLFRSFDKLGPWSIFSREIWNAPIFAPGDLHLALSENQLWPALLLWPIWKLTGGLVLTMGIGLFAMHFAAFGAAAGWLSMRGIRDLRFWGGLVFALCGWLQSQYAHWQNGCIFVLPLALWAWELFRKKPGARQLVVCALAFGWICGWNLYFSVMASYLLAALLLHAWMKKDVPRLRLLALGALALAVQLPILWRYSQLAGEVGQFAAWDSYPANAWSWLGRFARPSLLESALRLWPRVQLGGIEGVGFVGFTWAVLSLFALTRPRARWPLFAAAISYWISLGLGHGLFDLLVLLPPFSALRAIGRFQIAVMVATLPAVFTLLEDWRGWRRFVPIALVLIELWPAGPSLRMQIPETLDGPQTPLEEALSNSQAPVLVLDDVNSILQLALVRSGAPIFEGYSGRPTPTGDLLYDFSVRRRMPVIDLLDLTSATRVLAVDGLRIIEARNTPRLRERGCYSALGRPACLYDVIIPPPTETPLRFAADTALRIVPTAEGIEARFFATRKGRLDFNGLASCRVLQVTVWPFYTSKKDIGIEGRGFTGIRYEAGSLVYRKALSDEWKSWPSWLRPKILAGISCRL